MGNNDRRTEKDIVGSMNIPAESLSGIHTGRAVENFGLAGGAVNERLLRAYGLVKLACLQANRELGYLEGEKAAAIEQACIELSEGKIEVDVELAGLQGGAGTSTNMYVNEVVANRALAILGHKPGEYDVVSPLGDVNMHQSTNDTYPTALRVASMFAFAELEQAVSELADEFQKKEKEFAGIVKLGRTQLQDAVPMTLGQEMGAYAEAFSKDRWRIYKCTERLRVVNLGGTAIGTGLGAPQKYIFLAAEKLRQITNLPLARAENLVQGTQNCDEFVEVSGILKTMAANLFKVSSDLRLLSSGPQAGLAEVKLPERQAGSSIMPGKINPVIAELAGMVAIQAVSRDSAITMAAMSGQMELNAFMPLIAYNLLAMLDEMIVATDKLAKLLVADLKADKEKCEENVHSSTAVVTVFANVIGYDKASEIAKQAVSENKSIKELLLEKKICTEEEYEYRTSPEAILSLGFRDKRK